MSSLCNLFGRIGGYTHLSICGDHNLKEITRHDYCGNCNNHNIEPFLEKVDDLFLFQHITEPTRYRSSDTPSLLDLVFTNECEMISFSSPLGNSDHVCIKFDLVCYTECK